MKVQAMHDPCAHHRSINVKISFFVFLFLLGGKILENDLFICFLLHQKEWQLYSYTFLRIGFNYIPILFYIVLINSIFYELSTGHILMQW